jgi:hypothetical protein
MPVVPPFRSVKNLLSLIALWAMMALGVLFILVFVVLPILVVIVAFKGACGDDKTDSTSPDSRHIVRSVVRTCQHFGPDIMVTQSIELAKVGGGVRAKVFQDDIGGWALAHWPDSQHLDIEIGSYSEVALSLHDFDGVHITHYVPRRLMSTSFSDTQIDALHQTGRLNDADYETMKKGNQFWREWEERFIHWASENATIVQK